MATPIIDVLVSTFNRPTALAVTLASLSAQATKDFSLIISDQGDALDAASAPEVRAVQRVLRSHGVLVRAHKHLPRRGMAEQRQFLLDAATAPYVLFLDDDVLLEPDVLDRLLRAMRQERCGFVGCAVIGLSFLDEVRPRQQHIEFWDGPVWPERVQPDSPAWERHHLHSAANLYHVQQRLQLTPESQRTYRVAWIGGCVLYDVTALRESGGFAFWRDLPPEHCGEDVLAQLRVMARYGGCGIIPSGAFHQEVPTTLPDRRANAPRVLAGPSPADGASASHSGAY
ncbi:MAG TPA: glycosyltransferase family 2 protein [Gemmatimonadaceae bacterium]|nr:glycosyltransferase family 2 protein [Gemmatimonadaceae bacterium]